jgi:hypothetical protein
LASGPDFRRGERLVPKLIVVVDDDISKHCDLRALYLLLINYHHQRHKDERGVIVSPHEKIKLSQDALCTAERCEQGIAELKQTIEDLRDGIASKEVKWTVREKQLTT